MTKSGWFDAINNKNISIIKLFIDNKFNIDITNINNNTALGWAVQCNHTDILLLLLKAGANVNHQNDIGLTALHTSIQHKDIILIDILLDAGADMSIKDINGNTAYMFAKEMIYSSSSSIMDLLNTHEKKYSSVKTFNLDTEVKI